MNLRRLLSVMYKSGRGVPKDYVQAHMWWSIAASLGDKMATKNRDLIAKEMSPSDLSKAQKLAKECVKKKFKKC